MFPAACPCPGARRLWGSLRPRTGGGGGLPFPMAHTLRSFSLPGSCTASPRPMPSRRCSPVSAPSPPPRKRDLGSGGSAGALDLRALSHHRVRCELPRVAAGGLLDAPLGFWSLSGLLTSRFSLRGAGCCPCCGLPEGGSLGGREALPAGGLLQGGGRRVWGGSPSPLRGAVGWAVHSASARLAPRSRGCSGAAPLRAWLRGAGVAGAPGNPRGGLRFALRGGVGWARGSGVLRGALRRLPASGRVCAGAPRSSFARLPFGGAPPLRGAAGAGASIPIAGWKGPSDPRVGCRFGGAGPKPCLPSLAGLSVRGSSPGRSRGGRLAVRGPALWPKPEGGGLAGAGSCSLSRGSGGGGLAVLRSEPPPLARRPRVAPLAPRRRGVAPSFDPKVRGGPPRRRGGSGWRVGPEGPAQRAAACSLPRRAAPPPSGAPRCAVGGGGGDAPPWVLASKPAGGRGGNRPSSRARQGDGSVRRSVGIVCP